jgi:hypothetical protein
MDNSILPPVGKLLQPQGGNFQWEELSNCYGDDRFTAGKPDAVLAEELTEVCLSCEVFLECSEKYAKDAVSVWAAGEWRE